MNKRGLFRLSSSSSQWSRQVMLVSLVLLLLANNAVAVDDIWRALGLANNTEMAEMITAYQMKEHEQHATRNLQQVASSPQSSLQLGDKCGSLQQQQQQPEDNDDDICKEGDEDLECTRVGLLAKRCFPLTCLEEGLKSFHSQYDMEDYQQTILTQAGISKEELRSSLTSLGDDKREFLRTDIFRSLQQAIEQHAAPADAIFGMYDDCVGSAVVGQTSTVNGTVPKTSMDRVTYLGMHFEAGLIIDAAFDVFWQHAAAESNAFVRYCIGGGLGGGAEFTFLYLLAQKTNNPEAIAETCHFIGDVDFGLPVALGVAYGTGLNNGIGILEMTAGVGVEISAGVSFCGVSKA